MRGFEPSGDVLQVFRDLETSFGHPWTANGVASILVHSDLPDAFDKEEWREWFFKPADGAFQWAHERGLIEPWKRSTKWTFTELGREAASYARLLCDRGEKGKAGNAVAHGEPS